MSSPSISFKISNISNSLNKQDKFQNEFTQQGVHIYNPGSFQWNLHETKGRFPSKRLYHHSFYESPYFFIYGGLSHDKKKILHDMFCLNCENFTWKRFFFLEGPTPRLHSALCEMDSNKYIIGGVSLPENLLLNDIWSFSFGFFIF